MRYNTRVMAKEKKTVESRPSTGGAPGEPREDFWETPYIVGVLVFFAVMAAILWRQGFFTSK